MKSCSSLLRESHPHPGLHLLERQPCVPCELCLLGSLLTPGLAVLGHCLFSPVEVGQVWPVISSWALFIRKRSTGTVTTLLLAQAMTQLSRREGRALSPASERGLYFCLHLWCKSSRVSQINVRFKVLSTDPHGIRPENPTGEEERTAHVSWWPTGAPTPNVNSTWSDSGSWSKTGAV